MKEVQIKDTHTFRPRYSETDQMGVVYYGNYAAYFEVGRVELLRKLGISYAQLEANGTMLPVVHMSIDFKRGAKYDEEVLLETAIRELPTRKISFYHTLRDEVWVSSVPSVWILWTQAKRRLPYFNYIHKWH